jgi:hypothetical protein
MSTIVTGFTGLWPRRIYDIRDPRGLLIKRHPEMGRLHEPGVYVLYRGDRPYYIGKTERSLFERIHDHANKTTDKYYHLWDFFSAFCVPREHLDEVEAILIAAIPTANSANPKITPIALPEDVRRILSERRKIDAPSTPAGAKPKTEAAQKRRAERKR